MAALVDGGVRGHVKHRAMHTMRRGWPSAQALRNSVACGVGCSWLLVGFRSRCVWSSVSIAIWRQGKISRSEKAALGPAVACIVYVEEGQATWRRRAWRRPRSQAGAQVEARPVPG